MSIPLWFVIDGGAALCHHSGNCRAELGEAISLRVSILASGSSGNCTLLEAEHTRLLVDAGLGKRETLARLAASENKLNRLDGILISHEHADHCNGLPQVLGMWRAPVYLTEPTHCEVRRLLPGTLRKRMDRVEMISAGQRFLVGDIEVSAFAIPHDAAAVAPARSATRPAPPTTAPPPPP